MVEIDKKTEQWLHYRMMDILEIGGATRAMLIGGMPGVKCKAAELREILLSPSQNANNTILEDCVQAFIEGLINDSEVIVEATVKLELA
jgi:hypothetical protein